MPSFSSLFTSLTGAGFFYEKSSRHTTYNFNQDSQSLYRNQPRLPFEYYVAINLDKAGAGTYISKYFNNPSYAQVAPLIKSVEMPSMKIDTESLNQYNRKRISQSYITFEPVKMVFHDVCDGKTLKFWEMYYRYYFSDGIEFGKNEAKQTQQKNKVFSVETLIDSITPKINPNIANLPADIKKLFQGNTPTGSNLPNNTTGDKSTIQNIVTDTLDNHNFGYNVLQVKDTRNLIKSIDIFQVHGGRFNQVTLVNPRISAFNHDTLDYADTERSLELTFTFSYEYAYYTIQNLRLDGEESNNDGSTEPFEHGEFLELPALAFNSRFVDFLESNNPLLNSDNPILQRVGKNVQSSIGSVTGQFLSDKVVRRISSSALDGLANISPKPYNPTSRPAISTRPFGSTASPSPSVYQDMNRTGGTT